MLMQRSMSSDIFSAAENYSSSCLGRPIAVYARGCGRHGQVGPNDSSPCPSLPMRRQWAIRAGANPGPPFMARLGLAHLLAERQRAYPLALSGVDRIEERRGD